MSEAQLELDMQKLRIGNADRVLQKSNAHLHSQRMEFCQANQLSHLFQKDDSWMCTELDKREKVLQNYRMRNLEAIH